MKSADDDMTIGELAGRFGLATHVLRHWEEVGLLAPARASNGRRRYRREHLVRIGIIQLGKEAGFSLEQLRDLLAGTSDRAGQRALLQRHLGDLARRIARARASMELIEHALTCDAEDFTRCPGFLREVGAHLPAAATGRASD